MFLLCFASLLLAITIKTSGSDASESLKPKIEGNIKKFPLCDAGGDSHGRWYKIIRPHINDTAYYIPRTNDVVKSSDIALAEGGDHIGRFNMSNASALPIDIDAHFLHPNGPGEALQFDDLWLPKHCSYLRFTNASLERCVDHEISKGAQSTMSGKTDKRVHLVFLGDSALRGVVCGLSRILSGSEVFGPSHNSICGGIGYHVVSTNMLGMPISLEFYGGRLMITFIYVKSFHIKNLDWHLEFFTYNTKPYAIILNTGAWDFDELSRQHMNTTIKAEECTTPEEVEISKKRADAFVNRTMWELGFAGQKYGTKMIYRNNHHQARFGTVCADKLFEDAIYGSPWTIFDSRRMSKDIWRSQTYDGFHFDRHCISSVEHHEYNIAKYRSNKFPLPGALEQQFSHSLLNLLFRDCITDLFY